MGATVNAYEEARKQTIEDNKKKLEEFGLSTLAKKLADVKKPKQRVQNQKPKEFVEPRRSSRARNVVVSYNDYLDIGLPVERKPRNSSSFVGSYIARPLEEIRLCSYEERVQAIKAAEIQQNNLQSSNPSFVKSMVRSHVYSCFWLGLPNDFCKNHLKSSGKVDMILEDESGKEFDVVYISERVGMSGGWRALALEHKLDDGDALVFELIEPTRFKIYITRLSSLSKQENNVDEEDKEIISATAKTSTKDSGSRSSQRLKRMKIDQNSVLSSIEEVKLENAEPVEEISKPSEKRKVQRKGKPNVDKIEAASTEGHECVSKMPRKRKERLLCKRAR